MNTKIHGILLLSLAVGTLQGAPEFYTSVGRAFPTESKDYVTLKFREVNHNITWDALNYLEGLSAKLSSCNYPAGMRNGYDKIPVNSSWVAFIEFGNTSVTARLEIVAFLNTAIDMWISTKKYDVQIKGASKFGCTASPGCGKREARMGISCIFSPGSPMNIPEPRGHEDEPIPLGESPPALPAPPAAAALVINGSDPIALSGDQYVKGQLLTGKRWERGHFLENLSRLETNCEMATRDMWDFTRHLPVIHGLDAKPLGFHGRNILNLDVEMSVDSILRKMKEILPPNIQIGCTYIPDCRQDVDVWVVLSCLYEERCRKQLCF